MPVITTTFALTLVSDVIAPDRSTAIEAIPTPPQTCTSSLQALIDATPTGGTLTVPACIYRESVTIRKPITLNGYGAIIDGRDTAGNLVRSTWLSVAANDVTVRGFTMRYANGTYATGSVENAVGVQRFRLEDCDLGFSYVNLNLTGAIDSTIKNCAIHDAKHLGVRVSSTTPTQNRGQRNQLIGNRIFHNARTGEPDPGADSGNLKATGQDFLVLDGNEVYDSGKGLWLDAWCRNSTYRNNRIHDNGGPGIHDETSTGSKIYNNVIWRNGADEPWGWGAGILVAASKDTEVYGNTLAWNKVGISVISQDRSDSPGVTGTYVHDNIIVEDRPSAVNDRYGLFWAQDWPGPLYATASNNRGSGNRYFYPAPEDRFWRFVWDGGRSTLSDFNGTPGEQGGTYLTRQETDAILGADVPIAP